ncbi:MAG: DUF3187 family protein [Pseudomonadales bacterium]|nr:DUF3187 family protein [Pseudomonadales bacterium]MBO6596431.1 DUF3187 family protein [Pseudomonadales bacterium]MBO6822911.1 DUF3187 family protein [Pseudomonadales bacterium]
MSRIILIAILTSLIAFPQSSLADLFEPFSTSNLNPFVQVYGIPATRSAYQAADGQLNWHLQTEIANNFTESREDNEVISIDGETWRTNLSLRYGMTERWEVALDVPYMRHDGGSLDSFIEDWHGWFGLPNGGREDVMDDQLTYLYQLNGITQVDLRDSVSGIGDVSLSVSYLLGNEEDKSWSVRAGVKLPTGDPNDLTGSDGTDVFMSLHLSDASFFRHDDWYFHGSIGLMVPGDGDIIEGTLEDYVVFGSTTVAWHSWKKVSLKAQLDFHSAMYDSDLKELDEFAVQLVLGGTVELGEKLLLDISVSEDIVTDASPDVVFQLGLRSRF